MGRDCFSEKIMKRVRVESHISLSPFHFALSLSEQRHKRKHPGCRLRLEPARSDR